MKRAWLLGLVLHVAPFALVGVTVLGPTTENRLELVDEQFLGAGLGALESTTDRAGSHLAAMDDRGQVYELRDHDRLTLLAALPGDLLEAPGRKLKWQDEDLDGRCDLRVTPLWWGSETDGKTDNYWLNESDPEAGWQNIGVYRYVGSEPRCEALLNDAGEVFSLRVNEEGEPSTFLSSVDHRVGARAEGLPVLCADLDGRCGDELLTVAPGKLPGEAVMRGYQMQGHKLRQVWRHSFRIEDCLYRAACGDGSNSPLLHAADWNGDGRITLVVGEPSRGRLTYWQWSDEPAQAAKGRLG